MKVRHAFLQKVMKLGTIDTANFRYRRRNITEPEYQYAIIERVPIKSLPCSENDWTLVATTWDGISFLHA